MTPILLYDRQTGSIREEEVFEKGLMDFFYGSRPGFWITELLLKRRLATELYAQFQHSSRSKPKIVARDTEIGHFEFGGSTSILLIRPGVAKIDDDIAEHSARGIETIVRYGEKVGGSV